MLVFWIAAALLSAAAVMLVMARAAKPEPQADEAPEAAVYRRHLSELEELRGRGLLDDEAYAAARGEAGRRLLAVKSEAAPATPRDPRRDRTVVLGVAVAAILLGAGVYLAVGAPGRGDQPYALRLKGWLGKAQQSPDSMPPAEMAAVLKGIVAKTPRDPQVWSWLGQSYAQAGDSTDAVGAFEKAVALDPTRASDWSSLGVNLITVNDGEIGPDAQRAFAQAMRLDPKAMAPRFFLGQAAIESGHRDEGLAAWREIAAEWPAGDPRRQRLEAKIADVESGAGAQAAAIANAAPADQSAMIRGMVSGLAAKLRDHPDDAAGWARLVRSYGVLGDRKAQADALARARVQFKSRPADLATIEAAAH